MLIMRVKLRQGVAESLHEEQDVGTDDSMPSSNGGPPAANANDLNATNLPCLDRACHIMRQPVYLYKSAHLSVASGSPYCQTHQWLSPSHRALLAILLSPAAAKLRLSRGILHIWQTASLPEESGGAVLVVTDTPVVHRAMILVGSFAHAGIFKPMAHVDSGQAVTSLMISPMAST